jgi:hypothetical protein
MNVLQRMRRAIREQRYRVSSHANDEMADDFLMAADIENVILTGEVTRRFTHNSRGVRYEVLGDTVDYRRAYVVCRFLWSGVLLIITAYIEEG